MKFLHNTMTYIFKCYITSYSRRFCYTYFLKNLQKNLGGQMWPVLTLTYMAIPAK
jgi:hypothetical protein